MKKGRVWHVARMDLAEGQVYFAGFNPGGTARVCGDADRARAFGTEAEAVEIKRRLNGKSAESGYQDGYWFAVVRPVDR